jgi:hypothetical protein
VEVGVAEVAGIAPRLDRQAIVAVLHARHAVLARRIGERLRPPNLRPAGSRRTAAPGTASPVALRPGLESRHPLEAQVEVVHAELRRDRARCAASRRAWPRSTRSPAQAVEPVTRRPSDGAPLIRRMNASPSPAT